jgi:hypothetical protein
MKWREEEDGEGGAERDGAEEEGSGANGSDDPTRPMTKDEILAMQEKVTRTHKQQQGIGDRGEAGAVQS